MKPTINGIPIDTEYSQEYALKPLAEKYQANLSDSSPMVFGSALKEDLAAEQYDDTPMAISSSMKEDIARDADDDGPMFGRNWKD